MTTDIRRAIAGAAIVFVTAATITGLTQLPPPSEERAHRLDFRRAEDLRVLSRAIDLFWMRHQRPPRSLPELAAEPGSSFSRVDPETGDSYEYRPLGDAAYELCADFSRDSEGERRLRYDVFWSHGVGRQCFQLEVRPVRP